MTDFSRPLTFGTYKPTDSFRSAQEHIAVCFDDDFTLVAVTGYADDPENVVESIQYARLFSAAPDLLKECECNLIALRIFQQTVVANDMIVPSWVINSIASLEATVAKAKGAQS